MSYGAALKVLTTPPPPIPVTELTIIEGRTRRQIDALLRSQGVRGDYVAATRHSRLLDPRHYGAPAGIPSLEGFLFPSTYELREPVSISAPDRGSAPDLQAAVRRHRAWRGEARAHDALRRADHRLDGRGGSGDRPRQATRRLGDLQPARAKHAAADRRHHSLRVRQLQPATDRSAAGLALALQHAPHPGLPPTPIGNPGLASIQAAAHPANTNYLFFVVKPCGNGEHVFTSSYSQFLAYAQQYQAARAQRGGHSPTHC